MNRILTRLAIAVFTIASLVLAGLATRNLPSDMVTCRLLDCRMRCNEARCVRAGVDPYRLWKGEVRYADYVPWDFSEAVNHPRRAAIRNYVHAYPPWCYSLIMPLSCMDESRALDVWISLLWILLGVGTCSAFVAVGRASGDVWKGILAVGTVWMLGSPYLGCLLYGNYGIIVACAVAGALVLHGRGRDGLAGVCWTLAGVKPQIAALFLVPLILQRKWRTLAVWAALTAMLTLVASGLCHRSPWAMITCISDYSSGQFFETGFIANPVFVSLVFEAGVSPGLLSLGSALMGAMICGALTLALVVRRKSMLVCFMPALVMSTIWTASRPHDFAIQAVTAVCLLLFVCSRHRQVETPVRICSAVLIPIVVIMSYDSHFNLPVNVFRLLAVVGVTVWSFLVMTDRRMPCPRCLRQTGVLRCVLSVLLAGVALHGILMLPRIMEAQRPAVKDQQMLDFHMRRNEACCVIEGMDPFLLWRGDVRDDRYTPWNFSKAKNDHSQVPFLRFVHAYPPWEYAVMLPFTFPNQRDAGTVYVVLMFLSLAFVSVCAVLIGYALTLRHWCGLLLLAAVWMFYSPFGCCIMYGNFGVILAAAILGAILCQVRGWNVLAGVLWAFCFVKPQIAAIMLIPLLALRKWRTLLTVGLTLAGLAAIPSVLCGRSPWLMLTCLREYSENQFSSLALVPQGVFQTLTEEGGVPPFVLILSSTLVVGFACLALTVQLVKNARASDVLRWERPWVWEIFVFVPALALSTIWTSSRIHDLSVQSVTVVLVLVTAFVVRDAVIRVVGGLLAIAICFQYTDIVMRREVNVFHVVSVLLLFVWCWMVVRVGCERKDVAHGQCPVGDSR